MGLAVHDIIGFAGGTLILLTYFLLQTKKMSSDSLLYSTLNLAGALLILFSLVNAWNLTAVIIEVVWVGLSLLGIFKWHKANYNKPESYSSLQEQAIPRDSAHKQRRA